MQQNTIEYRVFLLFREIFVNKILLFFLCNVVVLSYACDGDRSSCPKPFLDMSTRVNQRVENQDDLIFCRLPNKGLFFAALDGHGTHDVARYISQAFPVTFTAMCKSHQ